MLKLKAFSLIELLIYLLIFSFLSLAIFSFFTSTQKYLVFSNSKNEKVIRANITLDLFKRDLICASRNFFDWSFDENKDVVFKKIMLDKKRNENEVCVGWKFNDDGAVRIEGDYDFKNKKWKHKNVSRANYNMNKINIDLKFDKNRRFVEMVELKFEGQAKHFICLRNRGLN
ncbi:prepilin-type N-terminal cleavage/methylation domain-containing protein [Candidatus Babeliales bacterium]|nr:prepilin-type N-terminal cleavage/methylation domain-containing protein [Candidatus Babeliales bacterium]